MNYPLGYKPSASGKITFLDACSLRSWHCVMRCRLVDLFEIANPA